MKHTTHSVQDMEVERLECDTRICRGITFVLIFALTGMFAIPALAAVGATEKWIISAMCVCFLFVLIGIIYTACYASKRMRLKK